MATGGQPSSGGTKPSPWGPTSSSGRISRHPSGPLPPAPTPGSPSDTCTSTAPPGAPPPPAPKPHQLSHQGVRAEGFQNGRGGAERHRRGRDIRLLHDYS